MTNFSVVVVLAAFVCALNANPTNFGSGGLDTSFDDAWEKLSISTPKPLTEQDIENLRPSNDTVVQGQSHYTSKHVETKNGVITNEESDTKDVTNDNGNVSKHETKN
ncbi:uncharacterized protein LOC128676421 [Plodia interpunctella]|uniref:uncharacterized protein LOC128676421 n=1 Tax=Plodia interpunctella TaxID=58824 RepID=UPI0023674B73|nr:uncharacterized protein LOC128676421 [Plodia interpunctella]